MQTVKFFGLIALAGLCLTVLVAFIQPEMDSWWTTIGFIGLAALLLGFFLALQSLFEFTIVATIGMERALAIFLALVTAGGLMAWWTGS